MSELFLCLDTSTPTARVAILDGDAQVRFASEVTADRHAAHLLPLCAEAMRAVGVAPADLAGIACGGGPGSFTGLRVGLAAAKGLALPTGVPLYLVSSLAALALDILKARPAGVPVTAVPCLDAGKGEVYLAGYAADAERRAREVAPSARLVPTAVADWIAPLGARPPISPPPSPSTAGRPTSRSSARPDASRSGRGGRHAAGTARKFRGCARRRPSGWVCGRAAPGRRRQRRAPSPAPWSPCTAAARSRSRARR